MKKLLLLSLLLSMFQAKKTFSQDISTDITGKKMSDFIALEKKLKSEIFEPDGDIVIPSGMAMPIMYKRTQKEIPDLLVNYVFTEKDSLIYQISYSWDPRNFEKSKASVKPIAFDKLLIKKYTDLLTSLTAKFGPSETKGELIDLQKIESNIGLQKSDLWATKDLTRIYMSIILANNYKFRENDEGLPLYKITIYVDHKKN